MLASPGWSADNGGLWDHVALGFGRGAVVIAQPGQVGRRHVEQVAQVDELFQLGRPDALFPIAVPRRADRVF